MGNSRSLKQLPVGAPRVRNLMFLILENIANPLTGREFIGTTSQEWAFIPPFCKAALRPNADRSIALI
jgi:hypothetical protein